MDRRTVIGFERQLVVFVMGVGMLRTVQVMIRKEVGQILMRVLVLMLQIMMDENG